MQVLKHCPALQSWLLNVALPDDYEVNPAHAYFVVCLFAYVSVFLSDRACLCCGADLSFTASRPADLDDFTLSLICCFVLHAAGMLLSCSVQSSLAPTLRIMSLSACFAVKLLQQYPAVVASALNCQSAACLCAPADSLCVDSSWCCRPGGPTGMQ